MFRTLRLSTSCSIAPSAREADWYNDDVAMSEIAKYVEGLLAMVRDTPGRIRVLINMEVDNYSELSSHSR